MLNIKKLLAIVLLVAVTVTTMPIAEISAALTGVYLSISAPSAWTIEEGGSVSFTLTYSGADAAINLTKGHIGLYGFTGDVSFGGSGNVRTVTVSNVKGSGYDKYLTVNAGTGISKADGSLANGVKSSFFTIKAGDSEAPVLTIAGPSASEVVEGGSVSYTLTYTDNVGIAAVNLTKGHIGLYGFSGDIAISGSGNTRTVTVSNVKNVGEGKYITVNAGTAIDAKGNLANGVKGNAFSIKSAKVKDTEAPVLTIAGPNPTEVTEGGSVTYTLTYTDNVGIAAINLTKGHIGLYGFTGDVVISGTGNSTRTVTINNVKNVGEGKYITVNAGTAIDADGNLANGVKGNQFKVVAAKAKDTVPPVLTIAGPSAKEVTEGSSVSYTLTYTDDVAIAAINLTKGHIGLYGFTGDVVISGTGNSTRTVTINNVKNVGDNKYITVNAGTAIDTSGNLANGVKGNPFKIVAVKVKDTVPPVLTIAGPNPNEVYEGETVVYTLKYTDNVGIAAINLTKGHIGLYGFTGDVTISGTGNSTRTVTIKNVKNVGTGKYITVNAGTAIDADGNLANGVKGNPFKIIEKTKPVVDDKAPILIITGPSLGKISNGGSVVYKANYTDNIKVVSISLAAKDIKLVGFTANIQVTGSDLSTRTITLTNVKGVEGSKDNYIQIVKGTAKDAAGNVANAATSNRFEIEKKEAPKPQPKPEDWRPNPNTGIM